MQLDLLDLVDKCSKCNTEMLVSQMVESIFQSVYYCQACAEKEPMCHLAKYNIQHRKPEIHIDSQTCLRILSDDTFS